MKGRFSEVRWGLILVAGVGTILLVAFVIFAVVAAYAASLAVQAQGPPDGVRIA